MKILDENKYILSKFMFEKERKRKNSFDVKLNFDGIIKP